MRRLCKAVLAFSIVPGVLVLDDDLGFVTAAQAVIGRPFTPLSVAGVARRTTRRAYRGAYYYGGAAAVAGAAAGAYYYGGGSRISTERPATRINTERPATRISTERPATRISTAGTIGTADTVTRTATEPQSHKAARVARWAATRPRVSLRASVIRLPAWRLPKMHLAFRAGDVVCMPSHATHPV
jgi:hypothetical protein